jgi:hypothetical protein
MADLQCYVGRCLYIVGKPAPKWAVLACPCGCRERIDVNLMLSRRQSDAACSVPFTHSLFASGLHWNLHSDPFVRKGPRSYRLGCDRNSGASIHRKGSTL